MASPGVNMELVDLNEGECWGDIENEVCKGDVHNGTCEEYRSWDKENLSNSGRETLVGQILGARASLSDLICDENERKISLFEALLMLPNGHLTVKAVLDSLRKVKAIDEEVEITLRSGLLFRTCAGQHETTILGDLLKVRKQSQEKGFLARAAIDGVLTHPVIEAFIRQKWHSASFLYFVHISLWFVFTIAFSCYLRFEINGQLIRNEFKTKFKQWNNTESSHLYAFLKKDCNVPQCIAMFNTAEDYRNLTEIVHNSTEEISSTCKTNVTREDASLYLELTNSTICHPHADVWMPQDSSKMVFLSLLVFSGIAWVINLIKTCRDYRHIRACNPCGLPQVCCAEPERIDTAKAYREFVKFLSTTTVFVIMLICFLSDNRNLKLEPATPLLDFDDGFLFVEIILLLMALYFVVNFFNEGFYFFSKWTDPSSSFQLVSSLAAIVTIVRKNYLTVGDNLGYGPATAAGAIGITFAYLCLILKCGRYNFTTIGNFATMFHIILKKLRSYLVVVFVLLFGFSFGFWVIKQHEKKDNDARFKGFLASIMASFVMFFGGFDEYNDVLHFDKEIEKGHHLTIVAFYILFLMMIVVSSLGMLNLLLAAIISDYKKNMAEVHIQNLISMAQHPVFLEQCYGNKVKDLFVNTMGLKRVENWARLDKDINTYTYCTLDLCFEKEDKATHIHPEEEFRNIIVKKNE